MKKFDISVAGEINLDLILYGLPKEMETERELLASGFAATLGSSSAILSHNAASLGAKVCFQTLVGPDEFGQMALERLQAAGVDTSATQRHETLQTGITLMLPHGAERHMLTYPGTIEALSGEHLNVERLLEARHFHLSSLYLQKGLHAVLPSLFKQIKQAGLSISVDTNDDPDNAWGSPLQEILPYVDCFMPNKSELLRMTRKNDITSALQALPESIETVVVKRGKEGATVRTGKKIEDVSGLQVTPVDTIGAGDSFDAGFLYAFLHGADALTSARAGNITGALSTQGTGGTEAFRNKDLRKGFLKQHGFYELIAQANTLVSGR